MMIALEYSLENKTEQLVDLVLERVLKEEPDICQCHVCINDMRSIALNSLEPRYSEPADKPKSLNDVKSQELYEAMSVAYRAMYKVKEQPRHGTEVEQAELHNYAEDLVYRVLVDVLKQTADVCTCVDCVSRMMSISLDQVKPKYTTSSRGTTFARIDELDNKYATRLMTLVFGAIDQVRKNPIHG